MPGSALLGLRYEPPFPYISDYGERGHTVLAGDFVSVEDGTGVVHTGAAFGEDDFRLAQDNGLTIQNPVRPDGTLRRARRPVRRHVRARRRPGDDRGAARVGPPLPRRRVRALLPALLALRHAAHLLRQDQLVRAHHRGPGRAAGLQRGRSSGTPTTSSTGASATGSRTTWTGRCRASATGARRCRSGAATRVTWSASARARRSRSAAGWCPTTSTGPTSTRRPALRLRQGHAPGARPDRRLVGLGLHALRPVARAVRERGQVPRALPGRLHLRGARPDARLVLLAARRLDDPVRAELLSHGALPRPDPRRRRARRCRSPRATWWCPGT